MSLIKTELDVKNLLSMCQTMPENEEDLESYFRLSYPKLIEYLSKTIIGSLRDCRIVKINNSRQILYSCSIESNPLIEVKYLLTLTSYSKLFVSFEYKSNNGETEKKSWTFDKNQNEDSMIKIINEYIAIFKFEYFQQNKFINIYPNLIESTSKSELSSTTIKKKEGCYIATVCYGSYDTPELLAFRHFRDTRLDKTILGRLFIMVYYRISPLLVEFIGENKPLKKIIRKCLDKIYIYLS